MTDPAAGAPVAPPVSTDRSLTLSEERLAVTTVRVPARRVRLEKYVVTETRTFTVEVSREEVRLVDVALTEADPAGGSATADTADSGRWMTLSEERVVVTTETVPVERVRLDVTTVVEERDVTEDLRREEITVDTDPTVRGAGPGAIPTTTEDVT